MVAARTTPALTAPAVEDAVVGRQAPGVARRGAGADVGCAALHQHQRHALGDLADALEEAATFDDPVHVREPDGRLGVVGGVSRRTSSRPSRYAVSMRSSSWRTTGSARSTSPGAAMRSRYSA